jgi:hypothetical protein
MDQQPDLVLALVARECTGSVEQYATFLALGKRYRAQERLKDWWVAVKAGAESPGFPGDWMPESMEELKRMWRAYIVCGWKTRTFCGKQKYMNKLWQVYKYLGLRVRCQGLANSEIIPSLIRFRYCVRNSCVVMVAQEGRVTKEDARMALFWMDGVAASAVCMAIQLRL